jgi:uncharacterized pyridoxamine 5'-phosphate oxidase family protein
MTKKEELLSYINENITDDHQLMTEVFYESLSKSGTRLFVTSTKQKAYNHINNNFDDDLVGHSGDNIVIRILNWTTQDKQGGSI